MEVDQIHCNRTVLQTGKLYIIGGSHSRTSLLCLNLSKCREEYTASNMEWSEIRLPGGIGRSMGEAHPIPATAICSLTARVQAHENLQEERTPSRTRIPRDAECAGPCSAKTLFIRYLAPKVDHNIPPPPIFYVTANAQNFSP